jgi:seryl-tRNA synthetase
LAIFDALNSSPMLQLQTLRENTQAVIDGLAKRHLKDASELVNKALELDKQKRALLTDTQERETKKLES